MTVPTCIYKALSELILTHNSLKYCDNPGYAKSVINLNTLFLLVLALVFYKTEINKKKILGVLLLVGGTYFVT